MLLTTCHPASFARTSHWGRAGGGENELFAGDQSEVCAALEGREQGWSRREVEEEGRDVLINV